MKYSVLLLVGLILAAFVLAMEGADAWQSAFSVDQKKLVSTGSNPYFNLTPGYRLVYKHGNDADTTTVLNVTKMIDGVETRAVEDRETKNGQLVELTLDYYAVDPATQDVYYFGEDVDVYKGGKVVGHEGAWLSGIKGAKFGLMIPGKPKPGMRFYQEQAPGVGMDCAEILAVNERVATPAGKFDNCIHARETSALEKTLSDHKWYAPGVGLVKDGDMVLVQFGKN